MSEYNIYSYLITTKEFAYYPETLKKVVDHWEYCGGMHVDYKGIRFLIGDQNTIAFFYTTFPDDNISVAFELWDKSI